MRKVALMVCVLALLAVLCSTVALAQEQSTTDVGVATDEGTADSSAARDFFPENIYEQPVIKDALEKILKANPDNSGNAALLIAAFYSHSRLNAIETGVTRLEISTTKSMTALENEIRHIGGTVSNIFWVIIIGLIVAIGAIVITQFIQYRLTSRTTPTGGSSS